MQAHVPSRVGEQQLVPPGPGAVCTRLCMYRTRAAYRLRTAASRAAMASAWLLLVLLASALRPAGAITITLSPMAAKQTFEAWGTSLCWYVVAVFPCGAVKLRGDAVMS